MNSGDKRAVYLEEQALPLTDLGVIGSALVVAPHPDDESLGCGGTIAQLSTQGYAIHVLFVSDGTMSHPNSPTYPPERLRELRESEAIEAIQILGLSADDGTFMRCRDRQVPGANEPGFQEAVDFVARLIDRLQPSTLFVPWRRDPHPDHRASWQIVWEAVRQSGVSPRVLEYLIWLWELGDETDMPTIDEVKVWRVAIDTVLEQRNHAIAAHRSQVTRLITDDPRAFYLSPDLLTHFDQPRELLLEGTLA